MDFSQIVLNHSEKLTLKKSVKQPVPENQCSRLLNLNFVDPEYVQKPGNMPTHTGFCRINNNGKAYLLYRRDVNLTRYFIPIVVSLTTTLLLNGTVMLLPHLLGLIQQWI